jgi:pyruvate,water dikinase
LIGGKHASLANVIRELAGNGMSAPDGFAITPEAFRRFIREAGIDECFRATSA